MGVSIQFESQHVELWAIYAMERDNDVLEYYDQPTRIQLHYKSRSGRKTSPWHTPDFLVIRRNGAAFEEWKPAEALEQLTTRMPDPFYSTNNRELHAARADHCIQSLFQFRQVLFHYRRGDSGCQVNAVFGQAKQDVLLQCLAEDLRYLRRVGAARRHKERGRVCHYLAIPENLASVFKSAIISGETTQIVDR